MVKIANMEGLVGKEGIAKAAKMNIAMRAAVEAQIAI